jgi:hypothetical protein
MVDANALGIQRNQADRGAGDVARFELLLAVPARLPC